MLQFENHTILIRNDTKWMCTTSSDSFPYYSNPWKAYCLYTDSVTVSVHRAIFRFADSDLSLSLIKQQCIGFFFYLNHMKYSSRSALSCYIIKQIVSGGNPSPTHFFFPKRGHFTRLGRAKIRSASCILICGHVPACDVGMQTLHLASQCQSAIYGMQERY